MLAGLVRMPGPKGVQVGQTYKFAVFDAAGSKVKHVVTKPEEGKRFTA